MSRRSSAILKAIIDGGNADALRSLPYPEYLKTDHWRRVRRHAIERANRRCEQCNRRGQLDVHHLTYDNLGQEAACDVVALCRPCHEREHER